ncbi:ImpA family type VI secretion system protein [Ralstonia sp. UBA689]|uniref:type VI secretion system protein TssA n=1 Tax=Ralstonia sp. UBA689 TaxID=1947373 RepID=UPI0025F1AD92|nr:type VI secretion system ImpA family N-terminal domain-containing protein [Ralstonia sp. UBA689]
MKTKSKGVQTNHPALIFPELLEPVSKERPCGDDLEYDPEFVVLQAKAAPKLGAQYGDFISAPEAINWSDLERDCRRLLLRTRDIRILVLLLRCRVRLDHAVGMRDGLMLLAQLLAKWPEAIHPQLMVDGEPDPVLRANALAALVDTQGLMQDVRDLAIATSSTLRLQVRDVERSLGTPRPADALTPESVRQQLEDLRRQQSPTLVALDEALSFASSIDIWARRRLPNDHPDLAPLLKLLSLVTGTSPATTVQETAVPDAPPLSPVHMKSEVSANRLEMDGHALQAPSANTRPTAPTNRDAVLATIRTARTWFETHEPSSPVALLLKQAERLTGRRFDEIFQAIPSDLVERWARED